MAKISKGKTFRPKNFLGNGAMASEDSGNVPKESPGMGFYYGRGMKNPQGRMRSDSIGYIPVSKKLLGTPPKSVV